MERRLEKKIGGQDIFYILTLFLDSTTIQLVRKLFLNPNEMVVSPRQGVKMCYSFPGICVQNLVFKALKMCSTPLGEICQDPVF